MRTLALWGYDKDECKEMFDLKDNDFLKPFLEYGCGPTTINSKIHETNKHVISIDPMFAMDKDLLSIKIPLIFEECIKEMYAHHEKFDFSRFGGIQNYIKTRKNNINLFLNDFEDGVKDGRYRAAIDYKLPFKDKEFAFVLSSHYFFAELEEFTIEKHIQVIKELLRIAEEVRIFPLINKDNETSTFLGPTILALQDQYGVEIKQVPYHLQANGNAMLRIWTQQCTINT